MNHLKDYLLKEWFVMKHIKIKIIIGLSPDEVELNRWKNL